MTVHQIPSDGGGDDSPLDLNLLPLKRDDIVKEGWLLKRSRYMRSWRLRWIVLTKDGLWSFKNSNSLESPTEILPLLHCTTVKSADELQRPHAFKVDSNDRVFYLIATSTVDKEAWLGAIARQMVPAAGKHTYCEEDVVY